MRKKMGFLFAVILMLLLLGMASPGGLQAGGQTTGGNLWDPFIDTSNFTGTKITGTLSIIYSPGYLINYYPSICADSAQQQATMFYSARMFYNKRTYTFQGATNVCTGDIGIPGTGGQGDVIMAFLGYNVKNYVLPGATDCRLKSVTNPGISPDNLSFTADILIMAK